MAITLKDVASIAGVSTATVSRALAGSERVSPQTADHVRTIASDLGYRYDNVARALRQKRSNLIGMVASDFSFPYARELLHALNRELFQDELVLAPVVSFGSVAQELAQVERLLGQRIDALLIMPANPFDSAHNSAGAIDIALEEEIPVIQLFQRTPHNQTADIVLDYRAGIELALRSLGRGEMRYIACVYDDDAFLAHSKAKACQAHQAQCAADDYSIIPILKSAPTLRESYRSALNQLTERPLPELIICSDNQTTRVVAEHLESASAAEGPPILLCLDPLDSVHCQTSASIVAIEFSMGAMAREILARINAALNDEDYRRDTVKIQPFINLGRL